MNASSSFDAALMGGPCSFAAFSLPPMASAIPPKVVPRVAIASCNSNECYYMLDRSIEDQGKGMFGRDRCERGLQCGSRLDDRRWCMWRP